MMGSILPVQNFMTEYIARTLENSHVDGAWQEISEHFVSKLVYYKRQGKDSKSEHEYLVAYIVDDKQKTSRLLIQRSPSQFPETVGKDRPKKTTNDLLENLRAIYSEGLSSSDATTLLRSTPTKSASFFTNGLASPSLASVTSSSSTVDSITRSSQDLSSKAVEADDSIRRLRTAEAPTDCVLRVFEPEGQNLSFLHFCIIVEDVHVREPNYHLIHSQCYWFAMMIMGISMLQGGRIQLHDIPQRKGTVEPSWRTLKAHTGTTMNGQMPTGLDHELPIPSLSEEDVQRVTDEVNKCVTAENITHDTDEDIKHITNVGSAGTIQSITYGAFKVRVISVSFSTIWEAGRESRNQYSSLCNEASTRFYLSVQCL
jgi:hypothetical protein